MEKDPAKKLVQAGQELPGVQPEAKTEPGFEELGLKYQSEEQLLNNLLENEAWADEERELISSAYELAKSLHSEDLYKGQPYIFHLLRVANRVTGYLHTQDAEIVAAALLHDSVEDHANSLVALDTDRQLIEMDAYQIQKTALGVISQRFSPRAAELVSLVTNPPAQEQEGLAYEEKMARYAQKVKKATQTPEGFMIKFADWCDNGLGIIYSEESLPPDRITHFQNKYGGEVLETFEARYRQPDIQQLLDPEAKSYIEHQLELGHVRLDSMRDYVETLASEFHERWRQSRVAENGSYEPQIETTKDGQWITHHRTDRVDIANTKFEDLPADWREENRQAAKTALKMRKVIGRAIHNAWLERNPWAKGTELDLPFDLLPPEDQARNLEQAELALSL